MKKSIIAVALLSMSVGISHAQSSAEIFGMLNLGYGVGNGGIYEGRPGVDAKFQQWGNAKLPSHWGIRGTEDLGNGNEAYFVLRSAFTPESGQGEPGLFGNLAYVGVRGQFGAFQAGRQDTISKNILPRFDASGSPTPTSSLGNVGISGDAQRFLNTTYRKASSALLYITPNFNGFSAQAGYVAKNDDVLNVANNAKNMYSLGALYNKGGFSLGAAYESKPFDLPSSGLNASWGLGAKYDFGSFLISTSYFDNHFDSDGKGVSVGASVPIQAFRVGAQVAMNTDAQVGDEDLKPVAWEIFASYNVSKRTQLYAQYGGINNDAKTYNAAIRKYSAGFGVIHAF